MYKTARADRVSRAYRAFSKDRVRGVRKELLEEDRIPYKTIVFYQAVSSCIILLLMIVASLLQFPFANLVEKQIYATLHKNYSVQQIYKISIRSGKAYYPILRNQVIKVMDMNRAVEK